MTEANTQSEPAPSNEDYYREVGYYQESYSLARPGDLPQGAQRMYLETLTEDGKVVNRRLVFDPNRWRGFRIKIRTAGSNSTDDKELMRSKELILRGLRAEDCSVFDVTDPSLLFALAPIPQNPNSSA